MTTQILIAGFGGQGILFAGKFLANKGMLEGRQAAPPTALSCFRTSRLVRL